MKKFKSYYFKRLIKWKGAAHFVKIKSREEADPLPWTQNVN